MSRSTRLGRLPSSGGIGPLNLFLDSFRLRRVGRFPNLDGMRPVSPWPVRSMATTRPLALVVIPGHSPRGALVIQLWVRAQFGPSVARYRRTSTLLSDSTVSGGVCARTCGGMTMRLAMASTSRAAMTGRGINGIGKPPLRSSAISPKALVMVVTPIGA